MEKQIGFIGLGNLGLPIAVNLLESGHDLIVFNRTISKAKPLEAKGATVAKNLSSLAKQCDIIFTIVSDDAALESICQNDDGLLNHMRPGSVHVSMSTILPQTAQELAIRHQKKQQYYIAAPVFGRPEAAIAKKLNFVTSGEEKINAQINPLLKDAGAIGVWEFGEDITAANTVKLCGNFLIASALEAIGESVRLANHSGVDAQKMWNMFCQTLFNTPVYQNYSNIILQKKFEPAAFTMKLGLKDMGLVFAQAETVKQSMPLANLLKENMQRMVSAGKDELDWSAVSMSGETR